MARSEQTSGQSELLDDTGDVETDHDSEWEWVYDEEETEDLYFSVILPSAGAKRAPVKRRRKSRAKDDEAGDNADADAQEEEEQAEVEEAEAGDADVPTTLSAEDVDITDLHTESPTVVYRGMEYSCRWATAVGTDMFFHKPGVTLPGETDAGGPPIAPQLAERVECVGMSAVRLVAVSARKLVASENNESPATPGDSHDADGGDGELPDEPAERQKAFLSMLESIQRRNGDADAVMQD